nr:immunoglobulin light chain junction region [Macaca mulatta]
DYYCSAWNTNLSTVLF